MHVCSLFLLIQILTKLSMHGISSKFHTVPMFVTVNIQKVFHEEFMGLFIICLHTDYRSPSSIVH